MFYTLKEFSFSSEKNVTHIYRLKKLINNILWSWILWWRVTCRCCCICICVTACTRTTRRNSLPLRPSSLTGWSQYSPGKHYCKCKTCQSPNRSRILKLGNMLFWSANFSSIINIREKGERVVFMVHKYVLQVKNLSKSNATQENN